MDENTYRFSSQSVPLTQSQNASFKPDKKNIEFSNKFKIIIFLFFMFIIITSEFFVKYFISKIPSAVYSFNNITTFTGTILQALILVFGYIVIEFLTSNNFV